MAMRWATSSVKARRLGIATAKVMPKETSLEKVKRSDSEKHSRKSTDLKKAMAMRWARRLEMVKNWATNLAKD
jgi:hypothetical protein